MNSNSKTAIFCLMLATYIDKYCMQENTSKNKDIEAKSKIKFHITMQFFKRMSAIY